MKNSHELKFKSPKKLPNQQDYTLADLSDKALVIASQGKDREEGEDERSLIKVVNYKTWWDKNREWVKELPKDEFVECVSASTNYIAAATTERYKNVLKIFRVEKNSRIKNFLGFKISSRVEKS